VKEGVAFEHSVSLTEMDELIILFVRTKQMYEAKIICQSILNKLLIRDNLIQKYNETNINDLTEE